MSHITKIGMFTIQMSSSTDQKVQLVDPVQVAIRNTIIQLKAWTIGHSGISIYNWPMYCKYAMELVESYKLFIGMTKEQIVIDVLVQLIMQSSLSQEEQQLAIKIISTCAGSVIHELISVSIGSTLNSWRSSCSTFCVRFFCCRKGKV